MTDASGYPVYPNHPVALVVLAVEFPPAAATPKMLDRLRSVLRSAFPLMHQEQRVVLQPGAAPSQQIQQVPRFLTRDRTMAVAVTAESVVIETTRYRGFDWYLDQVRKPIEAIEKVVRPDAVLSLGHRYIDEVRVPGSGEPDWAQWLDACLLAPAGLPVGAGLSAPERWQAMAHFQTGPESSLTLRYGPTAGSGVPADGTTRREFPAPNGPFFLLDWDSRWQPVVAPEFKSSLILEQCEALYQPVRSMFRHVTNDGLRGVFASTVKEAP